MQNTPIHYPNTENLRFPFLGTQIEGEIFQYLLLEITSKNVLIAISDWLVNRTILQISEQIQLHLPTLLMEGFKTDSNLKGIVKSIKKDSKFGQVYEITFEKLILESSEESSQKIFLDRDFLLKLIKDCMFLKNGILIYFRHLIPFFSRITHYSEYDYEKLKKTLLNDISNRIQINLTQLENLYRNLKNNLTNLKDLPLFLNLESLRETINSEIFLTIFQLAFEPEKNLQKGSIKISRNMKGERHSYIVYIEAIKVLENKLFTSYNTVVQFYTKSLE